MRDGQQLTEHGATQANQSDFATAATLGFKDILLAWLRKEHIVNERLV